MDLQKKRDVVEKVIITVAPVGSWPTREMNPNLPISHEEIAAEVLRSYEAGAVVAHIHARDLETEEPTADTAVYQAVFASVRAACPEVIVQLSTGSGAAKLGFTPEQRVRPIHELKPEMASLNAGSMNMHGNVFINSPETIEQYARVMADLNVKPEFEVYDVGMIENIEQLVRKPGLVPEPYHYGLVLGVPGGIPATVKNLINLVDALPKHCTWQTIAMGRHQIQLGTVGVVLGGGIRVGFEDNIYLHRGVLAKSNAELVEKAVKIIHELGLEIASTQEARERLSIPV